MKLYLLTIGISMFLISLVNALFDTAALHYVIIAVAWCTALNFALDGLIALVINKLPDAWFGVDNPLYRVSKPERRLYKILKVRRWKDKVWELGGLGGFSKKALQAPDNPEYIEKFIIECNKGVLTHRLSYPVGILVMVTLPNICAWSIALPVAAVNLLLNIMPTLALRYNTPMLKAVLKRLKKKEQKRESVSEEIHSQV